MDLGRALKWDVGRAAKKLLREPQTAPAGNRYAAMDILRLSFALLVLVHHALNQAHQAATARGPLWYAGIFPAVPCFLAISGFCILASFERTRSLPRFMWKRVLRIAPAFTAFFVLAALFMGLDQAGHWFRSWYTLGLGEGSHLWSLGWEEVFYASLAILWLAGAYRSKVLVWCAFACAAYQALTVTGPLLGGWTLAACFLAGNLVYLHRERLQDARLGQFAIGGLVFSWAVILYCGMVSPHETIVRALDLVAATFGLMAAIAWQSRLGVKGFDMSYGVYLYAPFAFALATIIDPFKGYVTFPLLCIAMVLPIAALSWVLIERPALKHKNARIRLPWRVEPAQIPSLETV